MTPRKPKLADPLALIRDGKLPERTVPICLAADLVAEYEELDRHRLEASRVDADSLGGGAAVQIAREMETLRGQMLAATVTFRLRALKRPVFQALKRQHPPRKGEDGAPLPEDRMLEVNRETFFDPLLRVSIIDPQLDEETYRLLVDERLTDQQFEQLTDMAWFLNVRRVDIPFSSAASDQIRTSAAE